MATHLRYAKNLYAGTAEYYDVFRPPYPPALFEDLRSRAPLRAASRVMDLACGTGQVAFAIADHVAEVVALDQEPEFVAFGEAKVRRFGLTNIQWIIGSAESTDIEGFFDLVAIGNAFHRLDRDAVATRLVRQLRPGGCVALLWSDSPGHGDGPWQQALHDTIEHWMDALDARDRVPGGWEQAMRQDPHEQVLQRAGLVYEGKRVFSVRQRWSVESLIGYVYSTSGLNRNVLGDQASKFEDDVRTRLVACDADGVFEEELSYAYELARRMV